MLLLRSTVDTAICAKPLARWTYGDWIPLQGAETANRAPGDVQLAMADRALAAAVHLIGRLGGSRELRLSDSRHKGARAGLDAVELLTGSVNGGGRWRS